VFIEVVKPERLVFEHVSAPRFRTTVTFTADAGKTMLTWRMLFDSVEECGKVRCLALDANERHLDRLEAEVRAS